MRHTLRLRQIYPLLVTSLVILIASSIANAQQNPAVGVNVLDERIDALLLTVARDGELDKNAKELVPELVKTLEANRSPDLELIILALERLKATSEPVVHVLCKKLDDPSHSVRRAAAKALVSVGTGAIPPLEQVLQKSSGRARAAALDAIGRLRDVPFSELQLLATDTDPRVRAVVARLLAMYEQRGVLILKMLLTDEEVSVAVEAASSLGIDRSDPQSSIPALIESLKRPGLGAIAARSLAMYGTDARRAIPVILKSYPLGSYDRWIFSHDEAEEALKHIGPPDPADTPELCELLLNEDPKIQWLTTDQLSLLETPDPSIAQALTKAIETNLERYHKAAKTEKPDDIRHPSFRFLVPADSMAVTMWCVTHDVEAYIEFLKKYPTALNTPRVIHQLANIEAPSADNLRLFERFLNDFDPDTRSSALEVIAKHVMPDAALQRIVLNQLHRRVAEELARVAEAITQIGPAASEEVVEQVVELYNNGSISIRGFVLAVEKFKLKSTEIKSAMEKRLDSDDITTAVACARVLSVDTSDASRTATTIIERGFAARRAISVLTNIPTASDVIVPYLMHHVGSNDLLTKCDAISALGKFGRAAVPATVMLHQCLSDKSPQVRIRAATAILLIRNDRAPFDQVLKSSLEGSDEHARFLAFEAIGELGAAGAPYLEIIIHELKRRHSNIKLRSDSDECFFEILASIGTDEAIQALEDQARSKDWLRRSRALSCLRGMKKRNSLEGN